MTIETSIALFFAMFALAVLPGPGVFTVVARSMSGGFKHGFLVTTGIVCGDYVFIVLVVYGLSLVAQAMGQFFIIFKLFCAAYLIFLGVMLWCSKQEMAHVKASQANSGINSYLTGLFVTLGNPKAIFFYIGFFPAFIDVNQITIKDISIILLIATIVIGGVMLGYAAITAKARGIVRNTKLDKIFNRLAGAVLIGTGIAVGLKN